MVSCIAKCDWIIHDCLSLPYKISSEFNYLIINILDGHTSYEETGDISDNIALEMIMLSYWSCFCFYIDNVITTINFVRDFVIMNTIKVDIVTIIIIIIIIIIVVIVIVLFELFQMLLNPELSDWPPPLIHSKEWVLKTYLLIYIVSSQVPSAIAVRTCLSWVLLTFPYTSYIAVLILCFPVTFFSANPLKYAYGTRFFYCCI